MQKLIEALRSKMGQHVGYNPGYQASGDMGDANDYRNYVAEAQATGETPVPYDQWMQQYARGAQ